MPRRYLQDRPPLIFASSAEGGSPYLRGSIVSRRVGYKYSARTRARNFREVKRCMRRLAELKHITTTFNTNPTAATWTFSSLTILSQGSGPNNRVGQQINVSRVNWHGVAAIPAASVSDRLRVVLLWDTEAAGANPAGLDVFETNDIDSCYLMDKVGTGKRFQIISDRNYDVIEPAASVATGVVSIRGSVKLDRNVIYQSNAGTVSDVLKNNLVAAFCSNSVVVVAKINFQMCYTDV